MRGIISLTGAVALGVASSAFAVTNVFTGAVNNQWGTAGNWSLSHVPTPTEDVFVGAFSVDVGGATLDQQATVTLEGSALSNGVLGDGGNGLIKVFGNNVTFAPNFRIDQTINRLFLTNSTYNNNAGAWLIWYDSIVRIKDGNIHNTQLQHIGGAGGSGDVTIDGGSHNWAHLNMNTHASTLASSDAILRITNNASVRFGNTSFGDSAGRGNSTSVDLGGTLRIDGILTFGSITLFNSRGGLINYFDPNGGATRGVYNYMASPSQFSGYLTLRMGGEDTGTFYLYEVGGTDLGAGTNIAAGVNYSLARLIMGRDQGKMKLVDSVNNDGGGGAESLYVDTLDLEGDTTIDLNGLNLYVHDIQSHGFTLTTMNGNVTFAIPEPSVFALLVSAAGVWFLRKRG